MKRILPALVLLVTLISFVVSLNFYDLGFGKFTNSSKNNSISSVLITGGSPYYPLKRNLENLLTGLAVRTEAKLFLTNRFARDRISEISDSLLNLRLKEADNLYVEYQSGIDNIARNLKLIKPNSDVKMRLIAYLDDNVNQLKSLASKFPEKESIQKTYRLIDSTRDVSYQLSSSQIKLVTPVGLDSSSPYKLIIDIRTKDKYAFAHIPSSVNITSQALTTARKVTPNEYYFEIAQKILVFYGDRPSFLLVGENSDDAKGVADQIISILIDKNKEIFIVENGFINYAMTTNYEVEGLIDGPLGKPASPP